MVRERLDGGMWKRLEGTEDGGHVEGNSMVLIRSEATSWPSVVVRCVIATETNVNRLYL